MEPKTVAASVFHCGATRVLVGHDDLIGRTWLRGKFWEMGFLQDSLRYLTPESVVCDCGANVGNHTVFWAGYVKHVHAIEGFEPTFRLLKANIEENRLPATAYQAILGDGSPVVLKPGSVRSTNLGSVEFVPGLAGGASSKLDDLVLGKVDYLKVDVEGSELRLLAGATRMLKEFHPVVAVEVHSERGVSRAAVEALLAPFGYQEGKDLILKGGK